MVSQEQDDAVNLIQSTTADPDMMAEGTDRGSLSPEGDTGTKDQVQDTTTSSNDRADSAYAASESEESVDSALDLAEPEEAAECLSKKRKFSDDQADFASFASGNEVHSQDSEKESVEAEQPIKRPVKKRRVNLDTEIWRALKQHMPSLRTQRKYLDENGKPLSVIAVIQQMTSNVRSQYDKENWQAKDYGEDEEPDFEEVRKMFLDDATSKQYFGKVYSVIERTDTVEEVEAKRRELGQSCEDLGMDTDDEGEDESYDQDDTDEEGSVSDNESCDSSSLEEYSMHEGMYKAKQMEERAKQAVKEAIRTPPRYLYRASSALGNKRTNGYDSITLHCPAAHVNKDTACHDSMYEIPNCSEMIGRRLLWDDRRRDETLSWTSSLLFALVHATSRLAKDQQQVVIHVIDTTKVTTIDGQPVEFHFAPDLLRLLDIKRSHNWTHRELWKLQRPWYTHEWITHNVVKSPREHSWEANIEEIITKGLYTFLAHLRTSDEDDMRGLYDRCAYTRSVYHRENLEPTPVTWSDFTLAKRLSRCFVNRATRRRDPYCIPPINLVIDFLAIESRPKRDEGYMTWIRSNYTQSDLAHVEYDRSVRVANNLSEQAQTLELARDACFALGLPQTSGTRVWMADQDFDWFCKWLNETPRVIKIRQRGKNVGESLLKKEARMVADGAEQRMKKSEEEKKAGAQTKPPKKGGIRRKEQLQIDKAIADSLEEALAAAKRAELETPTQGETIVQEDDRILQMAIAASIKEAKAQAGLGMEDVADTAGMAGEEDDMMRIAIEASLEQGMLRGAEDVPGALEGDTTLHGDENEAFGERGMVETQEDFRWPEDVF